MKMEDRKKNLDMNSGNIKAYIYGFYHRNNYKLNYFN